MAWVAWEVLVDQVAWVDSDAAVSPSYRLGIYELVNMNRLLPLGMLCLKLSFSLLLGGLLLSGPTLSGWADQPRRPNILLAIADDWSFGHATAYDCEWVETPSFDRVAREGILFTQAYTPNAKCAPSRASILTGRYSWQLAEAGNHMAVFPHRFGGFMERLAAAGYNAGFTGKGWGPGIALDADGRPRLITGRSFARHKAQPPTKQISNNDYAANFSEFLATVDKDQPWVFWYGATEPHRAYEFQSGQRAGKSLTDIDRVPSYWPDTQTVRHDMLDYALEVEHFDNHLGRILTELAAAGQLEQTLVVCTSDHGMPFPRVKGQAYLHSNHVPLAIRWPQGIEGQGRIVDDFVDFTDLAPTFLQAAGIEDPGPIMQPISGDSLFDIFKQNKSGQVNPARDHVLVGKERHDTGRPDDVGYPIRGIVQEDWLYLHNYQNDRWPAGDPLTGYLNCDGGPTKTLILDERRSGNNRLWWQWSFGKRPVEELYHLTTDADCVINVADAERYAQEKAQLKSRMEKELTDQGDPRMLGNGHVFDQYPYSDARTAQFYNRYLSGVPLKAAWVNPTDFESEDVDD